jgi:hypothetical protein
MQGRARACHTGDGARRHDHRDRDRLRGALHRRYSRGGSGGLRLRLHRRCRLNSGRRCGGAGARAGASGARARAAARAC